MRSSSLGARFLSSPFGRGIVDTFPLRIQCSFIVSAILESIGFHEIVERPCGDGGKIRVSYFLEAYTDCRYNRVDPVRLSQFEDWIGNSFWGVNR